jgi:predicted NBD/HSP70 family sugar kinase
VPLTASTARLPASQDDVRRRNLGHLLSLLHMRGVMSRAALTALTGLNRSTVKALTADLVDAGLAVESAPVGRGGAGRPSITVGPASDHVFVLSVDLGVERLTAARVSLGGAVLDRRSLRQTSSDFTVSHTLTRLTCLLRALLDGAPAGASCVGVGVGVCGIVSREDGTVRFAPNLGWVDVPLRHLMVEVLDTRLSIDLGNDGDVGALAEHLRGAGSGVSDMVFVAGEAGIGGGVIVDGQPFRGAGGYAGEVGHMSVDPKGRVCRCGRRGCWETEISREAVLLATKAPPGTSLEQVLTAYALGERWALPGMRRVGRSLGAGVANLVNIFNPELIVFGGVVQHIFAATEPLVRKALAEALVAPGEHVRLAVAGLAEDSVLLGAAELAFAPLLEDPLGLLSLHRPDPVGAGV